MKKKTITMLLTISIYTLLTACSKQAPFEEDNSLNGASFDDFVLPTEPEWITGDVVNNTPIDVEQKDTPTPTVTVTPTNTPTPKPTATPKPEPTKDPAVTEGEHGVLMGSYTTYFEGSSSERIKNIKNAVGILDGTVIDEGESFSCLTALLPFDSDNGYYEAGSYLEGSVVKTFGGGACQVSSTLYNAVLGAELEVTERHEHSMTVSYIEVARDAAIAEGSKDFCFINNSGAPVYIEGSTTDSSLTFRIWGADTKKKNGRKIVFEPEIIEKIEPGEDIVTVDESKPEDYTEVTQNAHTGYKAKLYKYVYKNGELVDKILINTSYYAPEPQHVTVGVQ